MADIQVPTTLLSDLAKFCGVIEDVILHEPPDFTFPRLVTLEITVHQLILTYNTSRPFDLRNSSVRRINSYSENGDQEEKGKLEILLTGIDAIERINQSGADNGTSSSNGPGHIEGSLVIRCKNLKIFQIDIRGYEKFKSIAESLDKLLSATVPERSKSERSDSLIVSRISFDQSSPKSPQSPYMPPAYPFHLYPFHYTATFKIIEDGWSLFQPEEEFAKIINSSSMEWRISYVNIDYSVCTSYPRAVVVPASITDEMLEASAAFRKGGRFPVLSYRHTSGNVIVRCSEPLVGPYNKRCREDEYLLDAFNPVSLGTKGYMIDTRNASAIASSKIKGGGIETASCYPRWKRINRPKDSGPPRYYYLLESYSKLMEACTGGNGAIVTANKITGASFDSYNSSSESKSRRDSFTYEKWMNKLSSSGWLSHVKDILTCGCLVAQCIERDKASVVVHGSDGRDLTLCVTSLAQVILNPDCRTVSGFEALIEREWLQAGHPFFTRTTKGPFADIIPSKSKYSAPTFTIFLDCVWQVHHQFPCSFEFNESFLMYLSDEAYSSKFGTFLGNNEGERVRMRVRDETVSVWSYTNRPEILTSFINCMYEPNVGIIWPSVAPVSLGLWRGMYLKYVIDPIPRILAERRAHDIVSRHIEARNRVVHLRRKLQDLEHEASKFGLLDHETSCAMIPGQNGVHQYKGMVAKAGANGTYQDNSYEDSDDPILKKRQLLQNIRQQENATSVSLNSSTNLNPVSSDSECSNSVFL